MSIFKQSEIFGNYGSSESIAEHPDWKNPLQHLKLLADEAGFTIKDVSSNDRGSFTWNLYKPDGEPLNRGFVEGRGYIPVDFTTSKAISYLENFLKKDDKYNSWKPGRIEWKNTPNGLEFTGRNGLIELVPHEEIPDENALRERIKNYQSRESSTQSVFKKAQIEEDKPYNFDRHDSIDDEQKAYGPPDDNEEDRVMVLTTDDGHLTEEAEDHGWKHADPFYGIPKRGSLIEVQKPTSNYDK
jgi:hypothetical protein